MTAPSSISPPTTSKASSTATSLPASAAGPSPSNLQISHLIEKFGREAVLASLSPRRAKAVNLLTSGIYGRTGSISSRSGDLQRSLASRLLRSPDLPGSTLFGLTWKVRTTPLGFPILAQRASARRTSDSAFGSWGTPKVATGDYQTGKNGEKILNLQGQAKLTSWPTPTVHDSERGGQAKRAAGETRHGSNLQDFALLASWATPAARGYRSESATDEFNEKRWNHPRGKPLSAEVTLASWGTPRVTNNGNHGSPKRANDGRARLEDQVHGAISTGSPAQTEKRGQLNPAFSRWLMGYPAAWDACAPTAMRSSRKRPLPS